MFLMVPPEGHSVSLQSVHFPIVGLIRASVIIIIIITDIVLLLTVNISTNFFTNDHNLSLIFNPETLHTQGRACSTCSFNEHKTRRDHVSLH